MTIATTTNRVNYTGNGVTTAFSFPYRFLANGDLVVILRTIATGVEVTKTLTTHYTVAGAGVQAGGTVTMLTAPTALETLTILRDPAATQEADFVENDPLPAETLETQLDRAFMVMQRLVDKLARSAILTDGSTLAFDPTLPAIIVPDTVLKFNATGDGFETGPSSADLAAAAANAAAAAASAAAALVSQNAVAASASAASTSASNAATSASNASTSETNAASSAAAAAANAAAMPWDDVVYKVFGDSPITVVDADNGTTYSCDTTGGAIVVNLPQISTLTLGYPWVIVVNKTSSDSNLITINRGGTDTFVDGTTSKTVLTQNCGFFLIPDPDGADRWTILPFGTSEKVVTTDGTQTLTNKTLTAPILGQPLVSDYEDFTEVAAPSTPGSGKVRVYAKTDKRLYKKDSNGVESAVGSGGGGGLNLLTLDSSWTPVKSDNFDLESSIGDWVSFSSGGGTIAQSLTATSSVNTVDTARWFGQSFVAGGTSISTAAFKLSKSGTVSGNMLMKIYSDTAGAPGTLIGTATAINASTLTGTATVTTFTFASPVSITNGNTYYAVLDVTSVTLSIGNAILVAVDTPSVYASGSEFLTLNSGASWSAVTANDLYFDIQAAASGLTLAGATSSLVTASRTTTGGEVLDGTASLKVVKSAANAENEGVSCNAYVPLGYRDQRLSIQFPFKILSGSLVDGDLKAYIYDITNSQLITPINNNATTSGLQKMVFNMPSNTTQIRVGLAFATTSTTAVTFAIDDIVVGPQEIILGMNGTDPQDYTPVFQGFGTCTNVKATWAQIGGFYYIQAYFETGVSTNVEARFGLPNGATIKAGEVLGIRGNAGITVGTTNDLSIIGQGGDDHVKFALYNIGAFGPVADPLTGTYFSGTTVPTSLFFMVPIEGASTNLITQNTGTFSIANVLANGTRLTGTAPTKLGEYRSYLRIANTATYTETNGSPTNAPSAADGIVIYGNTTYTGGDPSNSPSKYEIFIGKNIQFLTQWFASTGRVGYTSTDVVYYSPNATGTFVTYDPTTGIICLCMPAFSGALYPGVDENGGARNNIYGDIYVSQNPIPVQFNLQKVVISDHKSSGTDGGTATATTWVQRDLNTIENQQPWVSISSNQITLDPGSYEYDIWAPALGVQSHKVRLYNVTSSSVVAYGTSEYTLDSGSSTTPSHISGTLTITAQSVFKIEHWCTVNGSTYAFGANCNISGVDEIYTVVELRKVR